MKKDYKKLAEYNYWGLNEDEIREIDVDGYLDTGGHWTFYKVSDKEYEATYDGNYMHIFGSLEDLMARENEIDYYEYDSDLSEKRGEETFVNEKGTIREYRRGGRVGRSRDAMFKSQEPHEQKYNRKREWKEYKKEGWMGDWFKDGGSIGRIKVGVFNEEQLRNKEDKKAVEKAQKETGLKYVDTKIIKKDGKMFLEVYLIPTEEYLSSNKFAKGGGVGDISWWEVELKMPNGEIVYEDVMAENEEDAEYYGELTDSANEGGEVISVRFKGIEKTYANGGGVGRVKTYKLRAEGLNDFLAFLQTGMYMKIKSFTVEPIGVPDVVVTFETDSSLSEIKSKLKEVPDSHVMLQTIKPINEYTGERNNEYANGGKVLGKIGNITFTRGRGRGLVKDVYFKNDDMPYHYISYSDNIEEINDGLKSWSKIHKKDFNEIEKVHFADGGEVVIDSKLQDLSIEELENIYEQENGEEFEYDFDEYKIKKYLTANFANPKEYLFVDLENSFSKAGANWVIHFGVAGTNNADELRDLGIFGDNDYDKAHIIAAIVAERMKQNKYANGGGVGNDDKVWKVYPLGSRWQIGKSDGTMFGSFSSKDEAEMEAFQKNMHISDVYPYFAKGGGVGEYALGGFLSNEELQQVAEKVNQYIHNSGVHIWERKNKRYVPIEVWQYAGQLLNIFPRVVSITPVPENNGYLAKAEAINKEGVVISTGFGYVDRKESKWANSQEYELISFAQTRAVSRVLRNSISYIIRYAGYSTTPAEEMYSVTDEKKKFGKVENLKEGEYDFIFDKPEFKKEQPFKAERAESNPPIKTSSYVQAPKDEMLRTIFGKAEASNIVIGSPEFMKKIEQELLQDYDPEKRRMLVDEAYSYMTQENVVLESPAFMRKIKKFLAEKPMENGGTLTNPEDISQTIEEHIIEEIKPIIGEYKDYEIDYESYSKDGQTKQVHLEIKGVNPDILNSVENDYDTIHNKIKELCDKYNLYFTTILTMEDDEEPSITLVFDYFF